MCTSSPSIPSNKTPPAPDSPQATPDAPTIGARSQFLRSRGLTIGAKPDLAGLVPDGLGSYVNKLAIGGTPTPVQIVYRPESQNPSTHPSGFSGGSGGSRVPY